jgi:predicted PhzF superfamily epimerase YddE/YHI9
MNKPYLFQVFVDENGNFGNPGSLIVDGFHEINDAQRTAITADIGQDETVFIDNLSSNELSIYHAYGKVNFAGSVLVGVAWQLAQIKNEPTQSILCEIGEVPMWQEGEVYWLRAPLDYNLGNWTYLQVENPDVVDAIDVADTKDWKQMVWAWEDEAKGLIRARTFASKIDIPEVQGNGSGAMNLAGQLQRELQIRHGGGSIIYSRPAANNSAELGGRVIAIE